MKSVQSLFSDFLRSSSSVAGGENSSAPIPCTDHARAKRHIIFVFKNNDAGTVHPLIYTNGAGEEGDPRMNGTKLRGFRRNAGDLELITLKRE